MASPGKCVALFLIPLLVFFLGILSTVAEVETTENLDIHPFRHDAKPAGVYTVYGASPDKEKNPIGEPGKIPRRHDPIPERLDVPTRKLQEIREALGHVKKPAKPGPLKEVETTEHVTEDHRSGHPIFPKSLKEVETTEALGNPFRHPMKEVVTTENLSNPFKQGGKLRSLKEVETTENLGNPFKQTTKTP